MKPTPIARFALGLCAGLLSLAALAQNGAPLRIIVPFNPGGGSDLFARLIQPGLQQNLKRTVIVENRPGAGGIIGADYVAKAPADGNVLLLADSAAYTISPALYPALPYAAKDLAPVVEAGRFANVLLVPAQSPYRTLQDVIAAARKDPGKVTIASSGNGASPHLTAEKLMREARIQLTHVPYKGSGPALSDVLAGHVDMLFSGLPSVSEYLKGGKLRAIAIASAERSSFVPEVPTMAESGLPGFESLISQGLFAPAGTPEALVSQVNAAVNQFLNSAEMAPRLQQLKVEPHHDSAAQYKAWLDKDAQGWARLIKDAAIKVD
ncbi:tripartite tricarboxylate transporter substrate binding protein [Xylophilus rhododendri]|uniref:Tripartite tricarboxylate transporter substrate binding protein n=1 Tax=Xylophilus rhododendri TaxID=2697032 RepID=A0A857JB24_9BURK|nr:tripartite tricarboxylate transporter substrate binding protein [Xylophilus rhododendri]QHJ00898.1 tripartite tricarboxylate transporter substrate binding protein [Xylophilus rhododendri]